MTPEIPPSPALEPPRSPSSRRSVYIAYTGGTIGMARGAGGYRPAPGFLGRQMERLPAFESPDMPHFTVREYDPLLDSSNMTPREWTKIAADLVENYDAYDGFIVLHGTDTMAYSAASLSFMLENLGKTVLFTGSQIPLCEVRNDAYDNLITSLLIAASSPVPEVCLFVGNRLLRGNRSTKVSAARFQAFESPNYPVLGRAGVNIEIHLERALARPRGPLVFRPIKNGDNAPRVADIRLFPGIDAATLESFLAPVDGAVLHTYGAGNAPDDPRLIGALRAASERGTVIVNCTQCLEGSVSMRDYATGNALADAGVISGFDMTPEAALTKLYCLLSWGLGRDEVGWRIQESLRGELTWEEG